LKFSYQLYLSIAVVEYLFGELFDKALDVRFPDASRPDTLWKNRLDAKYFCFSGEPVRYEEAYNETDQTPYVRILMSPPEVTKNVSSELALFSP